MLRIRLQRIGRRDQPYFRVVVAEGTIKQEGKVVEIIGLYDPQKDGKDRLDVKKDRITYWKEHGAQMSDGAMKLLLSTAEKKKIWPDKKKAKVEEPKEESAPPAQPEKAEKPTKTEEEPAAEAESNGDTESVEETSAAPEEAPAEEAGSEGESTETKE